MGTSPSRSRGVPRLRGSRGARLMVTYLKDDGNVAGKSEPFAEGWNDNGYYLGRPVDVAQLPDGSLLVSDDLVGALYRISYEGK